jgi:hypothetical protein
VYEEEHQFVRSGNKFYLWVPKVVKIIPEKKIKNVQGEVYKRKERKIIKEGYWREVGFVSEKLSKRPITLSKLYKVGSDYDIAMTKGAKRKLKKLKMTHGGDIEGLAMVAVFKAIESKKKRIYEYNVNEALKWINKIKKVK